MTEFLDVHAGRYQTYQFLIFLLFHCKPEKLTSGTNTPEYQIFLHNQSKIADTISDITGLNDRIVTELYAKEIVGRKVKQAAEVHGPNVTETHRVRPVVDAILERIKGDKNMYYKVRDVLLSDTIKVDASQLLQYLPEGISYYKISNNSYTLLY